MARILAVEDNPHNLELMTYLVEASGHIVLAATTGERGVALAAAQLPHLVVLDIHLPEIDGYEVLRRLRADSNLAGLRVVAVTAYAMVGDRDHALMAGFDGYVSKPIDPTSFVRTIDTHLPAALRGYGPEPQWSARLDLVTTDLVAPVKHGYESDEAP
jgi:CheY-like chemotaxis protein